MHRMLTTRAAAARWGVSETTLRRRAEAGEIPGAVRLSGDRGPWRFPADPAPETPSPPLPVREQGRGDYRPTRGRLPHVTSSPAPVSHLRSARRVADAVSAVHTRPAVALADVVFLLAENATRHQPGRDGWCVACSWQYPCADSRAATAALERAVAVVIDGAR